jgi:hypothetical protein
MNRASINQILLVTIICLLVIESVRLSALSCRIRALIPVPASCNCHTK